MNRKTILKIFSIVGIILLLFAHTSLLQTDVQEVQSSSLKTSEESFDFPQPGEWFEIPNNGSFVELIPNEYLLLETPSGVTLNLSVGESVEISVNESIINPGGDLPDNASSIGTYLDIELNQTTDVNATLSMPYLPEELAPNVAEEALYFAFYNASTGEWEGVPSFVDIENHLVKANTTHFSTWTVLQEILETPEPGVPFEIPGNGSAVELVPGELLILETPSGITLNLTVGEGVQITINETTINPGGDLPDNASSVGTYLDIELNNTTDVEATLSMSIPDDLPSGVAEDALYFAFYNASTGEWEGVPSWVDAETGRVHANTTHFSTWTVLYDTTKGDTGPSTPGFGIGLLITSVSILSLVAIHFRRKQ